MNVEEANIFKILFVIKVKYLNLGKTWCDLRQVHFKTIST